MQTISLVMTCLVGWSIATSSKVAPRRRRREKVISRTQPELLAKLWRRARLSHFEQSNILMWNASYLFQICHIRAHQADGAITKVYDGYKLLHEKRCIMPPLIHSVHFQKFCCVNLAKVDILIDYLACSFSAAVASSFSVRCPDIPSIEPMQFLFMSARLILDQSSEISISGPGPNFRSINFHPSAWPFTACPLEISSGGTTYLSEPGTKFFIRSTISVYGPGSCCVAISSAFWPQVFRANLFAPLSSSNLTTSAFLVSAATCNAVMVPGMDGMDHCPSMGRC